MAEINKFDSGMADPVTLLHVPPEPFVYTTISPRIEMSINCKYEPKPDITAYELARLLPFFLGKGLMESDWAALGEATRHLRRID